jgi:hypothetical protein
MSQKNTLFNFNTELIPVNKCNLDEDFVAISSIIETDGFCKHSGLLICYDESLSYFHFNGQTVELVDITASILTNSNLYFKKLDIIVSEETVSFLGHCEKLNNTSISPLYGFVFNNSYYDSETKEHFMVNAEHDITTCVGFCIKVLRGFLFNHDEYLKLADWNVDSLASVETWIFDYINKYLTIYANQNNIKVDELYSDDELKRILPSELLSSGFFADLPIEKVTIDSIRPDLENHFVSSKVA